MIKKSKELINNYLRLYNYEIKKVKKKNNKVVYLKKPINTYNDLKKLIFLRDQNLVFKIPLKNCILGFGFGCMEDENPYSFYLKKGNKNILKNFYKYFKPNNIIDALTLTKLKRNKPSIPIFNPILKFYDEPKFNGLSTLGFKKKDGHILNGPISFKLQQFEIKRLDNLYKSIKNKGWKPSKFKTGFIRGIFLLHNNRFFFQIIGGNHRVACLAAIKQKYLDCWFQPNEPRFISSNFFSKNSLEFKIFKHYFDKKLKKKRKSFVEKLNSR